MCVYKAGKCSKCIYSEIVYVSRVRPEIRVKQIENLCSDSENRVNVHKRGVDVAAPLLSSLKREIDKFRSVCVCECASESFCLGQCECGKYMVAESIRFAHHEPDEDLANANITIAQQIILAF